MIQDKQAKRDKLITFAVKKTTVRSKKPTFNTKKKVQEKVNAEE